MSTASEIQAAARAIRTQTPATATFHRAVADLLDTVALADPEMPAVAPSALRVARAYMRPGARRKAVES